MKNHLRRIVPLILTVCIIICIGWYLFVYDRTFTRDVLLNWARYFDGNGNAKVASVCYDLAYTYSGNDEEVAIELANQYIGDGNYTKAEVTLTNAIADSGKIELYLALCKTYVDQDKLLDAVNMLDNISDPAIKAQLDTLRPEAPTASPEAGFYNQYITVEISGDGILYCNTEGQYPSTKKDLYTQPITLDSGETVIYAISVDHNGLVSPVSKLSYTINGVIEPALFQDPAIEDAVRAVLGVDSEKELYTNDLWEITEFTVPDSAKSLDDLRLLSYVKNLTIQNRRISTLSVLSPLSSLETLDLTGSRFSASDLSVLAQMPNLKKLILSNCGLSTIAGLEGALSLSTLDLSNNTVRNLDALSAITSLEELNLQHNAVMGLDALSALTNLTTLDISYNAVTSLNPLVSCTKLNRLDASNNSIETLSTLDQLPELQYLALDHNDLTDISLLGKCTSLSELSFSNNTVTNISCLNNMESLEVLEFAYNQVTAIPTWENGGALRSIDGSHNLIKNIGSLSKMQDLTYIYMDYNSLTSLDSLEKCTNLVLINVYGNNIQKVNHLTDRGIIVNYNPT